MDEWTAYFKSIFLEQRHSLMVVTPGRWGELPEATTRFDDAAVLKAEQPSYDVR